MLFKECTTLRVGGTIARVLRPRSMEECSALIEALDAGGTPVLVLGGGSNVLAPDNGFDGTVVIPSFSEIRFEDAASHGMRVIADAGVPWDALVQKTVERELWGLENLSGIPGNVGAAPIQNIGAYGTDVSKTIERVEVYDRTEKKVHTLVSADVQFGYRTSVLKKERGRFVVLRVSFILSPNQNPNLSYKDLRERFGKEAHPSLSALREAVIAIRAGKFPDLAHYGTAGSFFLNPVLSGKEADAFLSRYPNAPHFPGEGGVKFSLAWILDSIVKAKGLRVGGAFVWDRQPLVIATDSSGATAEDVRVLMRIIQEKVFDATRIRIQPEVHIIA